MATRAMIGMVRADGSVRAIYSHWDNYPAHTGILLKAFYDTADTVTALLDRGDVSSLGASLEETTFFNNIMYDNNRTDYPPSSSRYQFSNDQANRFPDIVSAVQYYTECWCEFFYVFEDGIWTVRDRYGMNRSLAGVIEDLREEKEAR
jgi:hypothetical protein